MLLAIIVRVIHRRRQRCDRFIIAVIVVSLLSHVCKVLVAALVANGLLQKGAQGGLGLEDLVRQEQSARQHWDRAQPRNT